jgi:hypothetical protein
MSQYKGSRSLGTGVMRQIVLRRIRIRRRIDGWIVVETEQTHGKKSHFEQVLNAEIVVMAHGKCKGDLSDGYAWGTRDEDRDLARKKYGLTDEVANKLLEDGYVRAIKAFGGEEALLRKYDQSSYARGTKQLDYVELKLKELREKYPALPGP